MPTAHGILPAPPLRDVLDDEEVLAGTDVSEQPHLRSERGRRRRLTELPLESRLLAVQLRELGEPLRTLPARVEVVVQRPVVEEPDEDENSDREPAAPRVHKGHDFEISR